MKNLIEQFAKFGVVGAIAFIIDYGVMVLLAELFSFPAVAAATVSFCVSVVFNYFASMKFVFARKEGLSRQKELFVFVALSVVGLAINDILMWLGSDVLTFDYRIVKIFATAVVMVWNFVSRKIFLEEKNERA